MTASVTSLTALVLSASAVLSAAIVLDINNTQSILDAAAIAAHGVQAIYNGNQSSGVLGKFPYPPYYWWESGGVWGGMMNYWHYTGDNSYNDLMMQALVSQLGPAYDFNDPNEAFDEGNDDQAFWAFAAMSGAEYGFHDPPSPAPSWLQICINTWSDYVSRWNMATCNGGLKWQFHPENAGYDYKQAISNGAFFQLSARLARYTANQTYVNWAEKVWDWCTGIGLIDNIYNVFDGSNDMINCSRLDHDQWSYNVGVFLYGAAILQNYTNASLVWVERTAGLLSATSTFVSPFPNATNVLFEAECEKTAACNVDQQSMKAYLARWLAATSLMAPFTAGRVGDILRASAVAASNACISGPYGNSCSSFWWAKDPTYGPIGLGQELSAMEVIYALLVNDTVPPRTLGNFTITSEPPKFSNVSATRPVLTPSASARPLFGTQSSTGWRLDASRVRTGLILVLSTLVNS